MNDPFGQFFGFLNALPPSKKASIAFTSLLVLLGFASMFMISNQIDYQVLFNDLSQRDAAEIVTKLAERNIPYKTEGYVSLVLVPADKVRDLRLSFAGDGLPKEGSVGFEIFDKTDFGATRFVQELNYRRALQGELERTISRFREVDGARVFVVLPKASLFVEKQKPAT
ncbi:MAG: flagellar basal-body MS-ring/collar protein FliF, partial [Desulfobacterales bacterium]